MHDFFNDYYLILKSVHIIAVISWMAGLLYLPRLFVYHAGVSIQSESYRLFCVMERRLLRFIMAPAVVVVVVTGFALFCIPGVVEKPNIWFHMKMLCVVALVFCHIFLGRCARQFQDKLSGYSENFFRVINEVPTLLMIFVVFLVVLKPF